MAFSLQLRITRKCTFCESGGGQSDTNLFPDVNSSWKVCNRSIFRYFGNSCEYDNLDHCCMIIIPGCKCYTSVTV